MCDDDSWRFGDVAAKRLDKTVGVYGCELVPATTTKSVTGTTRGEELFHRPELYRPWREPGQHKVAAAMIGKEQEIEFLTRRNNELRTESMALQRELQRTLVRAKTAEQGENEVHDKEMRHARDSMTDMKTQMETTKTSSEHQLRIVRSEHEAELKQLQAKVKLAQDSAQDAAQLYSRQLTEVKAAAAREVSLVQQLCTARTAELQNELDATKDGLRRLQDRTAELLAASQDEARRTEERCVRQLTEQEKRLEKMRTELHSQIQTLEADRDGLRAELHDSKEQAKASAFDLLETEARFKDWNVRLLSDLDQLYEYYYAVVRDVRGGDEGIAMISKPQEHGDKAGAASLKGVMERVADRLQMLTVLKQQHSLASQGLQKKIRSLEASSASTVDLFRRTSDEKDVQLSRLYAEVTEAKSRQARLEKAFEEVKVLAAKADARLLDAAHRLQFHADDLQVSLSHMGPHPVAPTGTVTFVATHVEGAAVLWEADAAVMQAAMSTCHDVLRAKIRQFGGYEFQSEASTMLIAFQDPLAAARFALEGQEWLLRARWPIDLMNHHAAREETAGGHVVSRGLRVAMTIHQGEAQTEESSVPLGPGIGRTQYYGKTLTQLMLLASFCSGGQIILSAAVWLGIRDKLKDLGDPAAAELGQHRIAVANRGVGSRSDSFTSAEMVTLHQLVPRSLQGRTFAREGTFDSSVSAGGIGLSTHFAAAARASVATEVAGLRSRGQELSRAVATLAEEAESVCTSVTSLACKVRDAQVNGRIYSQADIVAHIAAIDRIVARTDVIRRDSERVGQSQRETIAAIRVLEEQVALQAKVSMSEDEYKKKLDLVNDRANERLHEQRLQSEHHIQQLRSSLQRAEAAAAELRKQSAPAMKDDTKASPQRAASLANVSAMLPGATNSAKGAAPRPKSASASRPHKAIAEAHKRTASKEPAKKTGAH
jgi:hypothetical protein